MPPARPALNISGVFIVVRTSLCWHVSPCSVREREEGERRRKEDEGLEHRCCQDVVVSRGRLAKLLCPMGGISHYL